MKLFIFISSLLLLFNNSFAQSKNQIAERNIKSISQHIVDERKENKSEKTTFARYDKHGNDIELIEYNEDSTISKWEKHTYNKNGDETFYQDLDKKGKQKKKIISGNLVFKTTVLVLKQNFMTKSLKYFKDYIARKNLVELELD